VECSIEKLDKYPTPCVKSKALIGESKGHHTSATKSALPRKRTTLSLALSKMKTCGFQQPQTSFEEYSESEHCAFNRSSEVPCLCNKLRGIKTAWLGS
jgi:hypothetical protein